MAGKKPLPEKPAPKKRSQFKKIIPALSGMRRLDELLEDLDVHDLGKAGFHIISNPNFSVVKEKMPGNLARI